MARFRPWAEKLKRARTPTVLGGDLNIAHTERDIFYAKSNQNQSGFLPHEREWFGGLLELGWRDVVREEAGDVDGPYSWWSNRGQAWANNTGWRIDYQVTTPGLAGKVLATDIYRDERFSDHAPFTVDYDYTI